MEITTESLTWTSEDIAVFRQFLNTATGQKFVGKWIEVAPRLLLKGDTNAILIRNGEVAAWQEAARALIALANPEPPAPDQNVHNRTYPDPTDDSQWDDGKSTKPNA
jgi:hypothetical protein